MSMDMDWSSIIQMIVGGGSIAGIVEVCAAIRHRKSDKAKAEAEADMSSVEAQKAKMELGDLYLEKIMGVVELVNAKQDKGNLNQERMIEMLSNLDKRVDNLEVRMANVEGCLDGDLTEWVAAQQKKDREQNVTNRYGCGDVEKENK